MEHIDQSEHAVRWQIDQDWVNGAITCTAPEGAYCRMGCPNGHEAGCSCDPVDMGKCLAVTWINDEGGALDYHVGGLTALRDGPIVVRWHRYNECWVWHYPEHVDA